MIESAAIVLGITVIIFIAGAFIIAIGVDEERRDDEH
jgi:hypothetical protein